MQSKWFLKSKTIWGVIITGASTLIPVFGPLIGLDVSPTDIIEVGTSITDVITALGQAAGIILTIYGRFKSTGPVTVSG